MKYLITEYKKTEKGKIDLCLNGEIEFWLYAGEAEKFSLKDGKELTEEEYQHIFHEIIGKRAAKRAVHLLERQERTERKLREKLAQSRYPDAAIEDAVSYVKHYHYLDDERYARTYIRFRQEKHSRMRIWTDLAKRGVPKELIERCMEEEYSADEKEKICELLEKKHFSAGTADRKEYQKMYRFLMNRGFRSSDIAQVMRGEQEGDFFIS